MAQADSDTDYTERPHLLIIDDDKRIRDLVARYVGDHGHVAVSAANAEHARTLLGQLVFDLLVVDIMMPGENGVDFTNNLRAQGDDTPVLMLTALGDTDNRISGLESGADDYLSKPFEPRELLLRIDAILRRRPRQKEQSGSLSLGGYHYDPRAQVLCNTDSGDEIDLTNVEAKLLSVLARYSARVVTRETLARECGLDSATRALDVQITRLRRKLERDTARPRYLQTARGQGYVLYPDTDTAM
jgi:two-component system phosphate regulon response regulator OmpR